MRVSTLSDNASVLNGSKADAVQQIPDTYFYENPGIYFTGDGVRRGTEGYYWLMGRVDDVINEDEE